MTASTPSLNASSRSVPVGNRWITEPSLRAMEELKRHTHAAPVENCDNLLLHVSHRLPGHANFVVIAALDVPPGKDQERE